MKQKFYEMVELAESAVEDFREFSNDCAIIWAAKRIAELEKQLEAFKAMSKRILDMHMKEMEEICVLKERIAEGDPQTSKQPSDGGEFERLAMLITAELWAPLQFNPDFRAPEAIRYVEKLTAAHNADRAADKQHIAELKAELEPLRKMTEVTFGVGCETGKLFVHGGYDNIKWLQERLLNRGDEVQEAYKRGYEEGNEAGFAEGYNEKEQELT